MQRLFFSLMLLSSVLARAQTNNVAGDSAKRISDERNNPMIAFLTPAQQDEYALAHEKALHDEPALRADGEKILAQVDVLRSGTQADKQAFLEKMNAHRQKLRQAMLKADPKLEPIFAEIDKHISEAKAKQLGQVQISPPSSSGTH